MKRRVVAAVVASVLALAGVAMIALYVRGADERALASLEPTEVLVVTQEIARGETAQPGVNVEARSLPRSAVAGEAVTDPAALDGLVADAPLHPGEQVFRDRFATPESLTDDDVVVAPELVQVTILLGPERVLGGRLKAGDTVGVITSFTGTTKQAGGVVDAGSGEENDAAGGSAGASSTEERDIAISMPLLHKALVAKVEQTSVVDEDAEQPAEAQFITLAVAAQDATRVVWSAEHGTIWLSLERATSDTDGTVVITQDNVGR